jgi:hypothetical protein
LREAINDDLYRSVGAVASDSPQMYRRSWPLRMSIQRVLKRAAVMAQAKRITEKGDRDGQASGGHILDAEGDCEAQQLEAGVSAARIEAPARDAPDSP